MFLVIVLNRVTYIARPHFDSVEPQGSAFFTSTTDRLWTPPQEKPWVGRVSTLCWDVLRVGVEKNSWGFFFLSKPHSCSHASVVNAAPTCVLIPAFPPPVSFLLIPHIHLLFLLSLFYTSNTHYNTVLEMNSTHLFYFHLLWQEGYHQWMEKHFPTRLDFNCWFLLSTMLQAAIIKQ